MKKSRLMRTACAMILTALLAGELLAEPATAYAALPRTLTLQRAQTMAMAKSQAYKRIQNKIEMQYVKYAAAVKSIAMKKKNMATFRWTPLLSFKFPEQPHLVDEYEWQYKPVQITCEIDRLRRSAEDTKLGVKEEVTLLYVEVYVCQEKIDYIQRRTGELEAALERNRLRLATGEARQADLDKMTKALSKLNTDLSLQMRTFETKKTKLSKCIGLDVSTGYQFSTPFVSADIPRKALNSIKEYTLARNQGLYEAKLDAQLCLTSLDMMENFMRGEYGFKMNRIQGYVNQVKAGQEVDGGAFKKQYNEMLKDVDSPWSGKKRILFIKISREWFKGGADGSRYVEDDPYALYTAALDYADARAEKESVEEELADSVADGFETLITAKNAYTELKSSNETLKQEIDRAEAKNRLGKYSYGDLKDLQDEYEENQLEELDLLAEYSKLLYSYDRLTSGAITAYLNGEDMLASAVSGGQSYIVSEEIEGAFYYIQTKIEDNLFVLGIHIPEDFSLDITDFELYVDGTRVGDKTPADSALTHLALALDLVEKVEIYLYNGDELVDVCEIDSTLNIAPLEILGGYHVEQETDTAVAGYTYTTDEELGTATIQITKREDTEIAYYQITDMAGQPLYDAKLVALMEPFTYLSVLAGDLGQLRINLFDNNKTMLYTGEFNETEHTVIVPEEP